MRQNMLSRLTGWSLVWVGLCALGCAPGGGGDGSSDAGLGQGGAGGQGGGGQGGDGGVGGQGGEGGVGGNGGEGGVGGQGGEGGVGGNGGEGGVGGAGGLGGDGGQGGEGGHGGAPVECGPDEFQCGADCVDLLTDPAHCGSCGTVCADQWPGDGPSLADLGGVALCDQAECAFACADAPQAALPDFARDAENCGACGNACAAVAGAAETGCEAGRCQCRFSTDVRYYDGPPNFFSGLPCDGHCEVAGGNCAGGCCPALGADQVQAGEADGFGVHSYPFTLDAPRRTRLTLGGDGCADLSWLLVAHLDGDPGPVTVGSGAGCGAVDIASLPAGRYTALVWGQGAYTLERTHPAFEPALTGVEGETVEVQPDVVSSHTLVPVSVPPGLTCQVRLSTVRQDSRADGVWSAALWSVDGARQVWGDEGGALRAADLVTTGWVHATGDHLFQLFGYARDTLQGPFSVALRCVSVDSVGAYEQGDAEIAAPGVFLFDRIQRGEEVRLRMAFPEGGRRRLSVTSRDDDDCPTSDPVLTVLRPRSRGPESTIAHNDDRARGDGCPELTFDAEPGAVYIARIRGWNGGEVFLSALTIE